MADIETANRHTAQYPERKGTIFKKKTPVPDRFTDPGDDGVYGGLEAIGKENLNHLLLVNLLPDPCITKPLWLLLCPALK
jgi:hypothetical protein